MNEQALANALAFAEWGFPVFSVWGTRDGECLCPKGKDCTSPGKHPVPRDGLKAGSTDPDTVTKMLRAPGSGGQYGVGPRKDTIYIDADGEGWAQRVAELGLGKTFTVITANGCHLYFFWPPEYGPQPTRLFGWVVRSAEHPGYVIGPGSVHVSGKPYRIHKQNGHDTFEMLGTVVPYPETLVPPSPDRSITVSEGPKLPEAVSEGSRHDFLRDRARTLRGGGLTGDDLFNAVSALNRRLPEPKTDEEVRRAIGDVETKFAEDPAPISPTEAVTLAVQTSPLIVPAAVYVANTDRHPRYASPFAVFGHVSLISGPPKAGKSTFISGLVHAREAGRFYLWGEKVPQGPTLYISEESGSSFADKVDGLVETDVMDWSTFVRSGLNKREHVLTLLAQWCAGKTDPLVVIDTLAVWALLGDENDAMETNRAIGDFSTLADTYGAGVVMGHHSRKGGGEGGEGIRGSSAIFGAVALSIEFRYFGEPTDSRRKLAISGRFGSPETQTIDFNMTTRQYEQTFATPDFSELTKHIPLESSGLDGLTRDDLRGVWGKDPRKDIAMLLRQGAVVERTVKAGRVTKAIYFKAPPLLDVRPVATRMADIFTGVKEVPDGDES